MNVIELVTSLFKKRAITSQDVEWELWMAHQRLGIETSYPTMFIDEEQDYLVYVDRGKLFRITANTKDGVIEFGTPEEVFVEHIPIGRDNLVIERTKDGLVFVAIAGCATINRSLEIDTIALFDSLVEDFSEEEEYLVNFYHEQDDPDWVMGRVKGLMRTGSLLLAYGIIDENTLFGRQAAKNLEEGKDNWGVSIEFYPKKGEVLDFDGIKIRSYTEGKFNGLAIVLESDASHFYTNIVSEGNDE